MCFREHHARGNAVDHLADPDLGITTRRREIEVHTGKLHGLFGNKCLRQRVDPYGRHLFDLPQGLYGQRTLSHEHGLSLSAVRGHDDSFCPGGHIGRDGEHATRHTVFVRRNRTRFPFGGATLHDHAVKGHLMDSFPRLQVPRLKGHVDLAQELQRAGLAGQGLGGGLGLRPHNDVVVAVPADIEFFLSRAGPCGVVFRPAVDAGRQGDARGHGVKGGIGIHPHGIGP